MAVRRQGLYSQGSKTRIVTADELAEEATAADLGIAAYFFALGAMKEVKALIGPIFRRATHGGKSLKPADLTELRFSLYRLGKIGDDRALKLLLKELPFVGFLGDFVYLYLRAFVGRPAVVQRVVEVLDGLEPERDAYLAGLLLRTLEEAPSLPVNGLDVLRRNATSHQPSPAVRAVATTALGRHGLPFDETQIRTSLWREADPRIIRAQLAALVRLAPRRSRATLGDYKRAFPAYTGTVDHLLKK